jgi:hypothetical protein
MIAKKLLLKERLLNSLDSTLRNDGFKLNKSAAEFTKKTIDGWCKYQIIFLERGYWELIPGMLVRNDTVENIFHETSEFNNQDKNRTPTIGTSVENYLHDQTGNFRLVLKDETEIPAAANSLISIYYNYASPFFKKYEDINEIEKDVNADINDTSLTGPIFKGTKGIILAKLCNRENYTNLQRCYYEYYSNFSKGFYLPSFKKLTDYLKEI